MRLSLGTSLSRLLHTSPKKPNYTTPHSKSLLATLFSINFYRFLLNKSWRCWITWLNCSKCFKRMGFTMIFRMYLIWPEVLTFDSETLCASWMSGFKGNLFITKFCFRNLYNGKSSDFVKFRYWTGFYVETRSWAAYILFMLRKDLGFSSKGRIFFTNISIFSSS